MWRSVCFSTRTLLCSLYATGIAVCISVLGLANPSKNSVFPLFLFAVDLLRVFKPVLFEIPLKTLKLLSISTMQNRTCGDGCTESCFQALREQAKFQILLFGLIYLMQCDKQFKFDDDTRLHSISCFRSFERR